MPPTKTTSSSKTGARKSTSTARKPVRSAAAASDAHPVKSAAPKQRVTAKTSTPAPSAITPAARSRAAAQAAAAAAAATPPPKPVKPVVETVSLIDEKPKTRPKRVEGAPTKKTILPPISRILPPQVAPPAPKPEPPKPVAPPPPPPPTVVDLISPTPHAPKPAPPAIEAPAAPAPEPVAEAPAAEAAPEAEAKIIHIKPPIIVKQLAAELGVKPHQLIA